MSQNQSTPSIREAVGLFETQAALQAAIDELLSSGFDRADLSLLASEQTIASKLQGHAFTRASLEDDPTTPRGVYISPDAVGTAEGGLISVLAYVGAVASAGVIAIAGGPLTMIVVGAGLAGGAGGLIGAGLATSAALAPNTAIEAKSVRPVRSLARGTWRWIDCANVDSCGPPMITMSKPRE